VKLWLIIGPASIAPASNIATARPNELSTAIVPTTETSSR
jgi:hypothetical protein